MDEQALNTMLTAMPMESDDSDFMKVSVLKEKSVTSGKTDSWVRDKFNVVMSVSNRKGARQVVPARKPDHA